MAAVVSQSSIRLAAGQTGRRVAAVGLGPQEQHDPELVVRNGLLRVEPGSPVFAQAELVGGDGSRIGPVDLPLRMVVPMPVSVEVTVLTAPTVDVVVNVGASADPSNCDEDASFSSLNVAVGSSVTLSRGVLAVEVTQPGAWGVWLDSAGVALGSFAERATPPRGAASVQVGGVASDVVQYLR